MSFFSRSKGELATIFDIGSQNIGAAVILKRGSEKPQIIWAHRENFTDEKEKSARELLEAMLAALKKTNELLQKSAVAELQLKGFGMPSAIHYSLSSPWVEIEQKTKMLTFEKPALVTQKIIQDTLNQEKASLESSGFTLMEKTITGLRLNSYRINNPYNKKATSLEVSFVTATAPKEILDRIEESVSAKKSDMRAFSSAAYSAIRKLFRGDDFLFVAIEDNSTELTVVRDGVVLLHTTIFSGSNALTSAIAGGCGVSFAEAQSLLRLSFKKEIDKDTVDKIALITKQERDAWRQEIEAAIENAGGFIALPRTSFFIASDVGFIADIVKNQSIPEFGIDQTPLDIVLLDSTSLKDKILFGDAAYADTRLGLIAIAVSGSEEKR